MHTIEDEKNIKEYEKYILRNGIDRSVIDTYCEASKIILCGRKDREYGLKVSARAKELIFEYIKSITNGADFNWLETQSQKNKQSYDILDKYYDLLLYEAPYILDSYILYIEKNRPKKERFYEPRRKTLKQVADKLQELEDGKLDELFIHMAPRVGKSQIITLAMSWHCAKDAEKSNLYVTYKEGLGGAFLTGVMEIWTDPTYCFSDVFPKVKVADTDSKNHKVDLVRKKKYKTLSGKGLESGLNGEYDAYGWMVLDDILEGIESHVSFAFEQETDTTEKAQARSNIGAQGIVDAVETVEQDRTDAERARARTNIGAVTLDAINEVAQTSRELDNTLNNKIDFTQAQELSAEQHRQVQENLGLHIQEKTSKMILPVGRDNNGKLWTYDISKPLSPDTWEDVGKILERGLAPKYWEPGDQLKVKKTIGSTTEELVFDILGFDYDTPIDANVKHTMSLAMHSVYSGNGIPFDSPEATFYFANGLPA